MVAALSSESRCRIDILSTCTTPQLADRCAARGDTKSGGTSHYMGKLVLVGRRQIGSSTRWAAVSPTKGDRRTHWVITRLGQRHLRGTTKSHDTNPPDSLGGPAATPSTPIRSRCLHVPCQGDSCEERWHVDLHASSATDGSSDRTTSEASSLTSHLLLTYKAARRRPKR